MNDLQITTRIPGELAKATRLQADKEQRTIASLLRHALVQYLDKVRQDETINHVADAAEAANRGRG